MQTFTKVEVDAVLALCFTGNRERYERMGPELKRAGFADPFIVWSFPSPYRKRILEGIPHIRDLDTHPGSWGATWSHYCAVKTALGLGCETALIVEDDCRFLKDAGKVHAALAEVPADWDFLMLDSLWNERAHKERRGAWRRYGKACSTGCHIINRHAMQALVSLYEAPLTGRYMMRNSDHWADSDIIGGDYRIYCAEPNLAVQCRCPGVSNYGESVFNWYKKAGIDLEDYAPF